MMLLWSLEFLLRVVTCCKPITFPDNLITFFNLPLPVGTETQDHREVIGSVAITITDNFPYI